MNEFSINELKEIERALNNRIGLINDSIDSCDNDEMVMVYKAMSAKVREIKNKVRENIDHIERMTELYANI